jgi:hypothetical protein
MMFVKNPTAIECRTTKGVSYEITGQNVTCDVNKGFYCRNADNEGGTWFSASCEDYEVRFYCGTLSKDNYFPSPFVHNGISDFAIIYGTQPGISSLEQVAAGNLQTEIWEETGVQSGDTLVKDIYLNQVASKNLIVLGTQKICSNSALSKCNQSLAPGEYLIQVIANPYASGKVILEIYGYDIAELQSAVKYIRENEKFKVYVGYKYLGLGEKTPEPSTLSCTDSDGGLNYYVKGTVKDKTLTAFVDTCESNGELVEYTCNSDGTVFATITPCPSGYICSNGACVKDSGTTASTNSGILGNCQMIDGSSSGIIGSNSIYNCEEVCKTQNLDCAFGIGTFRVYNSSIGDQKVVVRACQDRTSQYSTYLSCLCC